MEWTTLGLLHRVFLGFEAGDAKLEEPEEPGTPGVQLASRDFRLPARLPEQFPGPEPVPEVPAEAVPGPGDLGLARV